jgi:hypothetical protein
MSTATASSFLNTAGTMGRVTISERERVWALVSARAEGISIRTLAAAAGLSPSRVHQLGVPVVLAENQRI